MTTSLGVLCLSADQLRNQPTQNPIHEKQSHGDQYGKGHHHQCRLQAFLACWPDHTAQLHHGITAQLIKRSALYRLQRNKNRHHTDTENGNRSEEHTSELQSLMRTSYAVLCLK